jgi:hypothetical protein
MDPARAAALPPDGIAERQLTGFAGAEQTAEIQR